MKHLLFCLVFFSVALLGDMIVKDGRATDLAVYDPAGWSSSASGFTGTGQGNTLKTLHLYKTEGLIVKARLSLERCEGTAAGIGIGSFLFGVDGGQGGRCFLEDCAGNVTSVPDSESLIQAGQHFTMEIRCSQGRAACFLNGRSIGDAVCGEGPETVFLRPWRSVMSVLEFSVTGASSGVSRDAYTVIGGIYDCHKDAMLRLPPPVAFRGPCKARLFPLGIEGDGVSFTADIGESCSVTLPAVVLRQSYIQGTGRYRVQSFQLELMQGTMRQVYRLAVQDSLRSVSFAHGEVRRTAVGNRFFVNGSSVGLPTGVLSVLRGQVNLKGAERFGKIGVHGKLVHLEPWKCFSEGVFDSSRFASQVSDVSAKLIAADPEATLMLQFELYMPPEWCASHPEELIVLDNGKDTLANAPLQVRQPSYASLAWRRQAGAMVRDAIEALRNSPVADRIWYFKLLYANCGEWNHWGYHELAYVDFSRPMNEAFGAWLKAKYVTLAALREAWQDPHAAFDSPSLVPGRAARLAGGAIFRGPSGEARRSADYYAFFQKCAADTIAHFARIAKDASGNRLAVGAYYGYYFGHYGLNYHFQDSGSYGVHALLKETAIDFIGGPDIYINRRSVSPLNGVVGSLENAGKLWESEDDYRTHLALGPRHAELGATANLEETCEMMKRNFAAAIANRTNYYCFDFVKDWYQDKQSMETLMRLHRLNAVLEKLPPQGQARLAVIFSEDAVSELSSRPDKAILDSGRGFALDFPLAGVPNDRYLLEDLESIDFDRYQTIVFFNAYRVSDGQLQAIRERAAQKGRTLVFVYAAGLLNDRGGFDHERSRAVTGISLAVEENRNYAPLIYGAKATGKETRGCRLYVTEPGAEALAWHADGRVAAARMDCRGYRTVVVCDMAPSCLFWRSLLADIKPAPMTSGVGSLEQTSVAWPFIGIGRHDKTVRKKLWFGKKAEVVADLWTGETLGRDVPWIELDFTQPTQTYLLYAGKRDSLETVLEATMLK